MFFFADNQRFDGLDRAVTIRDQIEKMNANMSARMDKLESKVEDLRNVVDINSYTQ